MSLNTPAQSLIILVNSRHEALAIVVLVKGPRMTPTVVPFLLGPRRVRGAGWCIMCMGPSLDLTKRQVHTLHTSYDFGLDLEMVMRRRFCRLASFFLPLRNQKLLVNM